MKNLNTIQKDFDEIAIIFAFILGIGSIIFIGPMVDQGYLVKTQFNSLDLIQIDCTKIKHDQEICVKLTKVAI